MSGMCVFCAKPGNQYNPLAFDNRGRLSHSSRIGNDEILEAWGSLRCVTGWGDEECTHDGIECDDLFCSPAPGHAACCVCQLAKPLGQLFEAEQHVTLGTDKTTYQPLGTDVPWGYRIPTRMGWIEKRIEFPHGTRTAIVEAVDDGEPFLLCEDCATRTHNGTKTDGNGYDRLDRGAWKTAKARGSEPIEKAGGDALVDKLPTAEPGVTVKQAMELFSQGETRTRAILGDGVKAGTILVAKVPNPGGGKPTNLYRRAS